MSTADSSTSDDAFEYGESNVSKRYPVHDCCEFEDAESLKRLIFVRQSASSDEESSSPGSSSKSDDDSSSSEDSNDSHAAAHAAAIGHSPQPVPPQIGVSVTDSAAALPDLRKTVDSEEPTKSTEDAVKPAEKEKAEENSGGSEDARVTPSGDEASPTASTPKAQHDDTSSKPVSEGTVKEAATPLVQTDAADAMDISPSAEQEKHTSQDNVAANGENGNSKESKKSKKSSKRPKSPTFYCPYDLDERDEDENTPLHVAIHARKIDHVKLLIDAGASVHKKCDGSAPIHTAISIGSVPMHSGFAYECVVVLTESGADLSVRDDSMHTPLYLACMMNLPEIASYILSKTDSVGMTTLNARSDRSGGRPLHAAAKHDTPIPPGFRTDSPHGRTTTTGAPPHPHHHPDGTIDHHPGFHRVPSESDRTSTTSSSPPDAAVARPPLDRSDGSTVLTHLLLSTTDIEVDAKNTYGQTPLHIACSRGNWPVVRLLLGAEANPNVADRRGFTPGHLAHRRGMPIPNDLLSVLGEAPTSGQCAPPRDLIVDPDSSTMVICHELCSLHRSCVPIRRDNNNEPPPENVRRLHVLINEDDGILRGGEFAKCKWEGEARRAAMSDILKVHEYNYVESISTMCSAIPDHPSSIAHLDADTAISRWSFEAALRAAGSVCEAVDKVVAGEVRNAFCAVRPPGHHAGPRGIVRCPNDPEGGSHGFCLLNNVAIGAAYARSMYRHHDIHKIAIVDFDVHHGNGTEEVIRQLVPQVETSVVQTPFCVGELARPNYRPWLDESDVQNVFFASTHGYGPRGLEFVNHPTGGGWFYPASGKSITTDAIRNPSVVESPSTVDFLQSQTWTRMGEESRMNCCKVINCGLGLPERESVPGMQRVELRDAYRKSILPRLREFDPDLIFISAGFDAHKRDSMNFGYVGMVEDDYEWVTEQLIKVANTCCNGRIVSVLEGGYKIHGGIVSPFARSVASHVRALVDGGKSRELYNAADGEWDSQFELHMVEDRERKRQLKVERLNRAAEETRQKLYERAMLQQQEGGSGGDGGGMVVAASLLEESMQEPSRKRRRNQVDYKELYEQMKKEGGGV